ncbi:MAG: class II SORL domain-containing protein [gamma proteobacterium symbiont of Taylorina sp.]|nr:class II SORL domain-containing protein [gamma proteobacterium symbiont of Taylorina sp.]
MENRREFLKAGVIAAAGVGSVVLSSNSFSSGSFNMPAGIVYTKENPGKWAKKVGGHAPKVSVNGNKITVETNHGMSSKHYIVRHTIVSMRGEVLAEKTFSPDDEKAISEFEINTSHKQLIATSFCNKHDMWAELFTV